MREIRQSGKPVKGEHVRRVPILEMLDDAELTWEEIRRLTGMREEESGTFWEH